MLGYLIFGLIGLVVFGALTGASVARNTDADMADLIGDPMTWVYLLGLALYPIAWGLYVILVLALGVGAIGVLTVDSIKDSWANHRALKEAKARQAEEVAIERDALVAARAAQLAQERLEEPAVDLGADRLPNPGRPS